MGLKTHLLISAALVVPQAVFAQGVIELDEAIVTSGLIPVEVNRTGASVEVLNEDEIRDAGQSIQNALARRPGVSVVANGGLGSESTLGIRGLGETYIGVTYDGIEVTDPAAPTNTFAFGQLSRAAAGRIELAKGTQTATSQAGGHRARGFHGARRLRRAVTAPIPARCTWGCWMTRPRSPSPRRGS